MRILLANHHLDARAGSELYTSELATALAERGNEVAVFTFVPGTVSDEVRAKGIRVFTPQEASELEAFDPEVAHVQHAPCLYFLGGQRLRCPVVFSSLGWLPGLEAPPLVWAGVARGLAISEETRDKLLPSPYGRAVPLTVFRNWFDERGLTPKEPRRTSGPPRWAVVTNHLHPIIAQHLTHLKDRGRLEWVHFGEPHNSTRITPELLEGFDGLITIGRTAVLAAGVGRPCLVYDVYGSDGLLTVENLPELATRNFSGRRYGTAPSLEELESMLLEQAPRIDTGALREVMWSGWSLARRAEEALQLYEEAVRSGPRLDEAARELYGRSGNGHAEVLTWFHASRERARALQEQLEVALRERDALRDEATALQAEVASLRSSLTRVEESLAWTTLRRARTLRDEVVTRSPHLRNLHDWAVDVLKRRRGP